MSKVVVVLQSNYIPWKGYFDLINAADDFVVFDEVQFTRRDWRNRNKIIVDGVEKWLTVPLKSKGHYRSPISIMTVSDRQWAERHFATLSHAYAKAPYFTDYRDHLQKAYESVAKLERLSEINRYLLECLASLLGISTHFVQSDSIHRQAGSATGRLVEICRDLGASHYLCGPATKNYLDCSEFADSGIQISYADYSGYPEYDQCTKSFTHRVSIIDLLMRVGPEARSHFKSQLGLSAISGISIAE